MKNKENLQRLIQEHIDHDEIVTMCCIDGTVKVNDYYVGYRFDKPYNRISHGYCPDCYENMVAVLEAYK